MLEVVVVVMLFLLSFLSGMLGLGVAFIAIPALGFFNFELKHVIMPWAVLLITTAAAPLGVYLLQFASTELVWWVFVALLIFLAYRMAFPPVMSDVDSTEIPHRKRVHAGIFGVFIGTLAGFLGVGPGFLMMPTLVLLGYTARIAAATNAVIVTLPSFSALAAHLATAKLNWWLVGISSVVSVIGAQLGAAFMARRVRSKTLARIFALALVGLAAYRVILLVK
jgi:hypothetical protein